LKRYIFAAVFGAALCAEALLTAGAAGAAKPTPAPSATPQPLPTATPEPPGIAIPRLLDKLKANPNDTQAMVELAGEYITIGHPEAAAPITQHLLQSGTKTAQVYYLDGTVQDALNNTSGALADLEQASNLEPTNLSVLAMLADLYVKTNQLADAERIANRAVTFNKDAPQAYEALAGVLAAEQKWDDARAQLEKAYALNPKDVSPLVQEAQMWVAQNTIPNALAVIDRAIAVDPTNVQVLVYRAQLFAKQNNVPQAAQAYDDAAAAAVTPDEKAQVLIEKALMYGTARQDKNAQATFQAAIAKYPQISRVHTAYGEYLLNQHNVSAGEKELLAAIHTNKDDVNALYDMAQVEVAQHHISDAASYLKQLADVAPSAQTYAMLGQAYVSLHQYTQARDACGKSFEMARNPDTLGCVAGSDYSLKNYKEAGQIFDALDKGAAPWMDKNAQLLYMEGDTFAHLNQKSKALIAYKKLLKLVPHGSKTYAQVEKQIAGLNHAKPVPAKKIKHG
jgi:tetratricopeptide (TPR) repeat protein